MTDSGALPNDARAWVTLFDDDTTPVYRLTSAPGATVVASPCRDALAGLEELDTWD